MTYSQKLPEHLAPVYDSHLNMGGVFTEGITYSVNNRYMTKNGEPWIPVMGEFHFSRYPHSLWREELLKMKAAGITIVATYLFWIHHEEERGKWLWEGDRNLSLFLDLCEQVGLQVWLRIGPWAHGECRHGGFPDWLMELSSKKGVVLRSDNAEYLSCVKEWFDQISRQLPHKKGEFIKSIIGIQLENEYGHCGGAGSVEHIRTLKRMASESGLVAPFYTVTGWGGANVPQDEVLVTMGGYAAHPWTQHTQALEPLNEYLFAPVANDPRVGGDLSERKITGTDGSKLTWDSERTPYLTCELGGGIQVTDHRRPQLSCDDITANILCKLGSGTNLPGYYMYHGGTNPSGKLSTLQESRESGYPNDLPVLSYDFQAMIGEYGRFSDAGLRSKAYHYFLRDFGATLAPMDAVFPPSSPIDPDDSESLRWSVRTDGRSGFVFVNNHVRNMELSEQKRVEIILEYPEERNQESVKFPSFDLSPHQFGFFPFNMEIAGVWGQITIKTALVQPVARWESGEKTIVYFHNFLNAPGEIVLDVNGVEHCLTHGAGHDLLHPAEGLELALLNDKEIDRLWIGDVKNSSGSITREAVFSDFPVLFDTGLSAPLLYREEPSLLKMDIDKESEKVSLLHIPGLTRELEGSRELYLELDLICDRAELFINGQFCADFFYFGNPWIIGLKRFEHLLAECITLEVRMTDLAEEKAVYFDCLRPEGTEIKSVNLKRIF